MVDRAFLTPGGKPPVAIASLMIAMVTGLVVFVFWGSALYPRYLALVPSAITEQLHLWRLVSAPLYFGELTKVEIAPFLIGLGGLWALGSPLERWLGTKRTLILVLTSLFAGHIGAGAIGLAAAPQLPLGGFSPGIWGAVTAVCLIYWPHRLWIVQALPARGKHVFIGIALGFVVWALVDLADGSSLVPVAGSVIGGLVGALFVTRGWRPGELIASRKKKKAMERFGVVQGGRSPSRPSTGDKGNGGNGRWRWN